MEYISFVLLTIIVVYILFYLKGFTHNYSKGEVDIMDKIEIGGMEQWIMANGEKDDLPILLWIHGGPGSAQMPVARYYNSNLEEEFIVVHWDQRGAGKSNNKDFDESKMTVKQYIEDTHELTQYLKERFNKEKIYLLGHSWGTQIGMLTINKYPEDYIAYIGVSQVSDHYKSHLLAHEELMNRIDENNNFKDLKKLDALSAPPYKKHDDYLAFIGLINKYGMNMDIGMGEFIKVALGSGIYSISDFKRWIEGANRGSGSMWEESQGWDMLEKVGNVEVPVFFIVGENDYNTPLKTLKEFYKKLDAQRGKEIYVISEAAHTPFFHTPSCFYDLMVKIKQKTE